jgi:hypothetical protein
MSVEFPELPEMPEVPDLPGDFPIDEQTVRTLWGLVRSLHGLLHAELKASRALAQIVVEDRANLEQMFGIVKTHHEILGSTIGILAELKGESPPFDLPGLPPGWPSPGNN